LRWRPVFGYDKKFAKVISKKSPWSAWNFVLPRGTLGSLEKSKVIMSNGLCCIETLIFLTTNAVKSWL